MLGNKNINFNTNAGNKGFESSDDGSDFEDPEAEVEINPKTDGNKIEPVKIEVNEKLLKIPCSEFFIYDFTVKKYISIGKGDFSIEFAKSDEKKQNPLLIFRNSVLKILFQGIFKAGVTKLETVNKNFKTISVIQKALVINEQTKKLEFKSVKIFHVNDSESKHLIETFERLEKDAEQSSKQNVTISDSVKISKKQNEETTKEEIDINQVSNKSQNSNPVRLSQNQNPDPILEEKLSNENKTKIIDGIPKNNKIININNFENASKPTSKQQTESTPLETKTNVLSQNKIQNVNLTQKEKESSDHLAKAGSVNQSKSVPVETKILITENIQHKPNETNEQITILLSTNQPTESKGKTPNIEDREKPVSKQDISETKLEKASPTKTYKPLSVGKITNITIQLISSNKSQDKN